MRLVTRRPSWPLLLLLASLGATAIAAVEAHCTVRSQRALAERALRDYAAFASWSYQQHLRESIGAAVREAIGAVNHGDNLHTAPRIPDASDLPHYLPWDEGCQCHKPRLGPIPSAFFGFTLGADTLGVALNTHTHAEDGWLVQPGSEPTPTRAALIADPEERRWIVDTLGAHIRRAPRSEWRFNVVIGEWRGDPKVLAYTLMPTTRGDTIVYGAAYTRTALAAVLAGILDRDGVLPASITRDRLTRDVVTVSVADARGYVLYESNPTTDWRFDATSSLPVSFGALAVRAQIRPSLAGDIIIGGLPRSRLPFVLALLVLSAALGLVAVTQLRRESELSRAAHTVRVGRFARAADAAGADSPLRRDAAPRAVSDRSATRAVARAHRPRDDGGSRTSSKTSCGSRARARTHLTTRPARPWTLRRKCRTSPRSSACWPPPGTRASPSMCDGAASVRDGAGHAAPGAHQPARQRGEVRSARADRARGRHRGRARALASR